MICTGNVMMLGFELKGSWVDRKREIHWRIRK